MLIQQYQSKFLDEETLGRVEKLFRTSMRKYGPEITLLLKKIIMVAMWIQYYQEITCKEYWIKFPNVLQRNESIIIHSIPQYPFSFPSEEREINKSTIESHIWKSNGCSGYSFFGLDGDVVLGKSLEELEKDIINYCNLKYGDLINID